MINALEFFLGPMLPISGTYSSLLLQARLATPSNNRFPNNYFDRAYAIASSEHIADKGKFFSEAYRVLRPSGRFVVCAWLAKEDAKAWQRRFLLKLICRQGRLPSMGSQKDYLELARMAGFAAIADEDISREARCTWLICLAEWRLNSRPTAVIGSS